jgi:hypothetical protein
VNVDGILGMINIRDFFVENAIRWDDALKLAARAHPNWPEDGGSAKTDVYIFCFSLSKAREASLENITGKVPQAIFSCTASCVCLTSPCICL